LGAAPGNGPGSNISDSAGQDAFRLFFRNNFPFVFADKLIF
jgi:hypothetical protein